MSLDSTKFAAPPPAEVSQVVEHLFRHETGKMVGTLVRIFGLEHLTLAEDVVQETLIRALKTWPFYGVPENPPAWLMRVARNLALDAVRRDKLFRNKEAEIIAELDSTPAGEPPMFSEEEIADDRLRMMFVCCHPRVPPEAQVALALKTLGGFNIAEISRAFLTTEDAIAKRLTRAKQRIREAGIRFEIPVGGELQRRLDAVLQSLYLLFNEGHKATAGQDLVRPEVCEEAIRLAGLLAEHPATNCPKVHALLALMCLTAARLPARVNAEGNLLRLEEQNRELWDRSLIARGMAHLVQSASGEVVSEYHLQAGIAACHCIATDYQSTNWEQILSFYDQLIAINDSAVIALNRAVAVANVYGPDEGIAAVESIAGCAELESYYLFYTVLGELEFRRGNLSVAAEHLRKAMEMTGVASEREFLLKRLGTISSWRKG